MGLKNRTVWFEPFYGREKLDSLSYLQFIKALCGLFIGLSGTVFCLVILFLGMRWVLNVGGFVASGGPYRIAHQAPDWIWIIPVSIFSAVFFILLHFFNSRKLGGIKILPFLWPALFLSLGYNFFDFAFNPPGSEGGLVVSWLICGILFVLMGGLPLLVVIRAILILIFPDFNIGSP